MAKVLFQVDLKKVGWGRFAQTGIILNQKGVGASLQLKLSWISPIHHLDHWGPLKTGSIGLP